MNILFNYFKSHGEHFRFFPSAEFSDLAGRAIFWWRKFAGQLTIFGFGCVRNFRMRNFRKAHGKIGNFAFGRKKVLSRLKRS
jgi:hypothetical protein